VHAEKLRFFPVVPESPIGDAVDRRRMTGGTVRPGSSEIFDERLAFVQSVAVQFVFADFATQGIAMNSQHPGGAALVTVSAFQGAFDKSFLEFSKSFLEEYSPFDHLAD
jgi:hypothetical protein